MTTILKQQKGFTILELMIATSVFAVILLIAAAGIISFSKAYYKGVTSSTTQQAARSILNDITQNIQLSSSFSNPNAGGKGCILIDGALSYTYRLGGPIVLPGNDHALVKDTNVTACGVMPTGALSGSQREMLGSHMRLAALDVSSSSGVYTVHIRVAYGDDDQFVYKNGTGLSDIPDDSYNDPVWWSNHGGTVLCKSAAGSQFCAISDLTTTVQQRL